MDDSEIDMLQRKLVSLTLYAETNRELLYDIQKRIEVLINKSDDPSTAELARINTTLKGHLSADFDFDLMKVHFEEVHPNFFEKLTRRFGELTHKEMRLAAFIKMRLTNKEIAFLLHITHNGVKKAIQRFRKKVDLAPDQSLRKFLEVL